MLREFASSQENDPYVMRTCGAGCSDNPTAEVHRARWSSLFDQMEKALCEEEIQLVSGIRIFSCLADLKGVVYWGYMEKI